MTPMIGEIRLFGGNFAPQGWAFCDGQLLAISQYDALFSILGTTYGGDGRTTFGLPDLRGRVAVGQGQGPGLSNRPLGQKSGTYQNTLTVSQMPSPTHTVTANLKAAAGDGTTGVADGNSLAHEARGNSVPDIYNSNAPSTAMANGSITAVVGNTGGSQPVNNMAPYLTVRYIIALIGIYPSRS